jgi:hypothetical protein
MKSLIFLIILMLCYSVSISTAQLRKASDYFPLQVGNVWEYDHPYQTIFQLFEVVSDTLMEDSVLVYKVDRKSMFSDGVWLTGAPYYYHCNPDSTIIYRDDIEFPKTPYTGLPIIDTGHGIGHRLQYQIGDCLCTFAVTDTGSALFFSRVLPWLEFNTINAESDSLIVDPTFHWRYVAGIGPTEIGIDTLVYAKINGIEYGTPVKVGVMHQDRPAIPDEIRLEVYPNPVSGSTTIFLDNIVRQQIEIQIIDILGRTVRTFSSQPNIAGFIKIFWDGKDDKGNILANGVYFVTAKYNSLFRTKKIIYLR